MVNWQLFQGVYEQYFKWSFSQFLHNKRNANLANSAIKNQLKNQLVQ